jgi:excisionase family DNA binding protein
MMRDADFGIVRVRAFGIYDFKIVEPRIFLKEVAGSDQHFRLDEFADTMRSRIVSLFSEALAQAKVPVLDVAMRYSELGAALLPLINPVTTTKYGLEFTSFVVENVSVPPEVEAAIDKRSSMAAVGNLNDYVKFQMAQGMGSGQGGGAGGFASEMAVGMAMAQQMMAQQGGVLGPQATPAAGATPPPLPTVATAAAPDLLSPADAAKVLGVSEADVLATLEGGELKGKKIGTTWRITKAALDAFLNS